MARAGIDVRTTYVLLVPVIVEVGKTILLEYIADPGATLVVAARVKGVVNAPVLAIGLVDGDVAGLNHSQLAALPRVAPATYAGLAPGQVLLYPVPSPRAARFAVAIDQGPGCPANATASFPAPAGEVLHGSPPVVAPAGPDGALPGVDWDGVLASFQQGGFSSLVNLGDLQVTRERLAGLLSSGAFERLNASTSLSGLLSGFTRGGGGLLGGLRELGAPSTGLVVLAVAGVAVAVLAAKARRGVARG